MIGLVDLNANAGQSVDGSADGDGTVEPRQPQPAPSRTVAAPTIGSKPAAIMVAASKA